MAALAENRRAKFDYEILETLEAGIELLGHEVKSVRAGNLNLSGSYGIIRGGEAYLVNTHIPPYQPANTPGDYDPARARRLLLHKDEIGELVGALHEKGISFLPLKAYEKNGKIKIEMGLGRSRKKSDKRELVKKRTAEREMRRNVSR